MIAGIFHEGSGLGDQLFRYVTVRTLAEDKGFEWGMVGQPFFKGKEFMKIEYAHWNYAHWNMTGPVKDWNEKDVRDAQGNDIRSYDPEINFIEDYTLIDGSFEDFRYWGHNLANVSKWLQTEPLTVPDDTCIIGFRGGEYSAIPQLFLPKSLYFKGVEIMKELGVSRFEVHTDDPTLAEQFFPDFKVIDNERISHSKHTNMGLNWRSARYAKYAIIPNSAFYIIPRLLKHLEDPTAVTLAPRYWAGHNEKIWKRPACYYRQFTYIHAEDTD